MVGADSDRRAWKAPAPSSMAARGEQAGNRRPDVAGCGEDVHAGIVPGRVPERDMKTPGELGGQPWASGGWEARRRAEETPGRTRAPAAARGARCRDDDRDKSVRTRPRVRTPCVGGWTRGRAMEPRFRKSGRGLRFVMLPKHRPSTFSDTRAVDSIAGAVRFLPPVLKRRGPSCCPSPRTVTAQTSSTSADGQRPGRAGHTAGAGGGQQTAAGPGDSMTSAPPGRTTRAGAVTAA